MRCSGRQHENDCGAFISIPAFAAHAEPVDCPLQGTWKSDAARTLADIAARNALSDRGKSALSDNFFGHMIHEWSCTDLRTWFDYQARAEPVSYRIAERTSDSLVVAFPDEPEGDLRIIFEGDCYKLLSGTKNFYEYFCPVESP